MKALIFLCVLFAACSRYYVVIIPEQQTSQDSLGYDFPPNKIIFNERASVAVDTLQWIANLDNYQIIDHDSIHTQLARNLIFSDSVWVIKDSTFFRKDTTLSIYWWDDNTLNWRKESLEILQEKQYSHGTIIEDPEPIDGHYTIGQDTIRGIWWVNRDTLNFRKE